MHLAVWCLQRGKCPDTDCGGLKNVGGDVLILMWKTSEHITFQGKRDFAHVMQFRIFNGKMSLDYPSGFNAITRV